jgi:hypothetical protein
MIVRDATDVDICHVVRAMRADDAFEVYSGRFDKTPESLSADIALARMCAIGLLALCDDDGAPIAILGALLPAPGRADVIMIATDDWPKISTAATRFVIRKFIPCYLGGVRSAECRCWEGAAVSKRWLARLGFHCAAVLPQHDDQGSTFELWRWINPVFNSRFQAGSDA